MASLKTSFEYSDELFHVGVAHDDDPPGPGSGRYTWGSGENPYQHQFDFLSEVTKLKKKGLKDAEIARMLLGQIGTDKKGEPIWANSTDLRAEISIQKTAQNQFNYTTAYQLYQKYDGNVSEVARQMGRNESSVRSFLKLYHEGRADRYQNTADMIRKAIDEKKFVDLSSGSELYLGVPDHTKKVAMAILRKEGYAQTWVTIPQAGTDKKTTMIVMAAPGTPNSEIQANKHNIKPIQDFTPDEGKTWWTPEFPESIDSKRVYVRYVEEGGAEKDGVIELRRGVEDISLGGSNYAQVRIAVDGTNYMKGMAVYGDDIPKGYDVVYNTNKHKGTPAIDKSAVYTVNEKGEGSWSGKEVMKRMKIDHKTMEVDRDNPFGALIKAPNDRDGVITAGGQRHYVGKDGKEHLSPINKLQDEGDWDTWARNLASQFLSKQPMKLIRQQIDLTVAEKRAELDEIKNLTNPVIKQKLLEDFASGCDSNAAKLAVKGFKNQAFQVLIPVPSLKDTEIYAPNFKDGDTVALIRYPHGGTFEIPILTVNNKQKDAIRVMGKNAKDAVGINKNVADRLSGADFDGDTAITIPVKSNRLEISSTPQLKGLEGFDPKELYKLPDSAPQMKSQTKQTEMGKVTNLITDMSIAGGATEAQIARAVRHSMVVIDAEKHHLDYKKSEKDNKIHELKKLYQGSEKSGASTIFSRARSKVYVDRFKEVTNTKIMTPEELERWNAGKKVLRPTGDTKLKQIKDPKKMTSEELKIFNAGKKVYRDSGESKQTKVYQMDTVDDARDLVRDRTNEKEMAYANYANELKDMGNEARKIARNIKPIPVSESAKKAYAKEVADLNAKLKVAEMNAPRERQAQVITNAITSAKFEANPDMDYEHKQRERARALSVARAQVGAGKEYIPITDREWDAIQANAISTNKLKRILNNTDQDAFKKRATPRSKGNELSEAQIRLIKSMLASGMYSQSEIAERAKVSTSTVSSLI